MWVSEELVGAGGRGQQLTLLLQKHEGQSLDRTLGWGGHSRPSVSLALEGKGRGSQNKLGREARELWV